MYSKEQVWKALQWAANLYEGWKIEDLYEAQLFEALDLANAE